MADANEAKKKALQLTLDKLDKTYGKGAVMKLETKTSMIVISLFYNQSAGKSFF